MTPGGLHRGWDPLKRLDDQPGYKVNDAIPEELRGDEVWLSSRYQCVVRYVKHTDPSMIGRHGMLHLSIHAIDRGPMRNWRHLQQIKNEVAGEFRTAVEVFPPEDQLTDTSNEYHLWVLPEGADVSYGIGDDPLVTKDDAVDIYNAARHKGRQEEWEPGLTTGRTEASRPARERMDELKELMG